MNSTRGSWLHVVTLAGLVLVTSTPDVVAKPGKTEAQLLEMLNSPDPDKVMDALDRLPEWYPDSTNAIHGITVLLRERRETGGDFPKNILTRRAARALGEYGAALEWEDVAAIARLLRSQDPNEVCDGLKAMCGLTGDEDIRRKIAGQVRPLLGDTDAHVVRDACRTLAVHGTREDIPALEPLTQHRRADVRNDAKKAIAALESKP